MEVIFQLIEYKWVVMYPYFIGTKCCERRKFWQSFQIFILILTFFFYFFNQYFASDLKITVSQIKLSKNREIAEVATRKGSHSGVVVFLTLLWIVS